LRVGVSRWPSTRAKLVFKALLRIGWIPISQGGSHIKLRHRGAEFPDYIGAFHDNIEIGPKMLARIAKHTGLKPNDI
jgi:predicted RNA binding protein YcfA (HicA-like mRNA interferase family)